MDAHKHSIARLIVGTALAIGVSVAWAQPTEVRAEIARLNDAQRQALGCRFATIMAVRKSLIALALRESRASEAEVVQASQLVNRIERDSCNRKPIAEHLAGLGVIYRSANDRMARDTLMEGSRWLFLNSLNELERRFGQSCYTKNADVSAADLAKMTDAQFKDRLGIIALGRCQKGSRGPTGGLALPDLQNTGTYAACVSSALRETLRAEACSDPAGIESARTRELREAKERAEESAQNSARLATERRAQAAQARGDGDAVEAARQEAIAQLFSRASEAWAAEAERLSGELRESVLDDNDRGQAVFGAMTVAGGLGTLTAVGVAVIVGASAPVAIPAALAGGAIWFGAKLLADVSARHAVRTGEPMPGIPFLCPALRTPSGPLTFASGRTNAKQKSAQRMNVLDAIRACRCENNPLEQVTARLPGVTGGSSCELGERLRCLRQAGNDVKGVVDLACMRLAKSDNTPTLLKKMRQCLVVNCGANGMIAEDCSCYDMSSGSSRPKMSRVCEQMRCPPDSNPVEGGAGCMCQRAGGQGPGVPGFVLPGGMIPLPGGAVLPLPGGSPIPVIPRPGPGGEGGGIPQPVPRTPS